MNTAILIDSLVQVARKRRLLSAGPAQRLGDYAKQKQLHNLDDMRAWLRAGDGLSGHLANQLLGLVPGEDVKPLGPYIPLAHLADGGMGSVWLACSPKNELVVVKTMRKNLPAGVEASHGTEFFLRFERETKITMQLNHPNVVRCLDSGQAQDGTPYMVLEYVDSGDLKDLVERRGGLPEGLALAILYQAADGLAEAHRIHLVHRDIKPPNIFVNQAGQAKLADFGIARSTAQNRTLLTMEGAIVGSPLYMSPEQIVTDPNLDIRSDIYALGAVLYYCLAGAPPFEGRLQEILHKHCTASIPDIRLLRPAISKDAAQIITTCMQKERAKRYLNPEELRSAIANALVKLGLTPKTAIEEETRQGDLSGNEGAAFKPANQAGFGSGLRAASEQATIAANLNMAAPINDPNAMTMAANLSGNDMTIAADLSGPGTVPMSTSDIQTIAASLLALDDPAAPRAVSSTMVTQVQAKPALISSTPAPDSVRTQTLATALIDGQLKFQAAKLPERFTGNFAEAITADWLSLLPENPADPAGVVLFARPKIIMGKLREAPVDLCLRYYPVATYKDSLQRVSRQHVCLRYDAVENRCVVDDQGSPNGTMLDGVTVKPGQSVPLENDGENVLVVANVVVLRLKCIPCRSDPQPALDGAPPSDGKSPCGIEHGHGFDAVVMTRPENRPEMAYIQVLRQVTIGGPGAQLVMTGARTKNACQICYYAGRWLWRTVENTPGSWQPVTPGTKLDLGGKILIAQKGDYAQF
jgi:serine/threonine protein kinase